MDSYAPYIPHMSTGVKKIYALAAKGANKNTKAFLLALSVNWVAYVGLMSTDADIGGIRDTLNSDSANLYSALKPFWLAATSADAIQAYGALRARSPGPANELIIALCHILYSSKYDMKVFTGLLAREGFTFSGDLAEGWGWGRASINGSSIELRGNTASASATSASTSTINAQK